MIKEFSHNTNKSFEDAIDTLKESLKERKFGTLCTIALSEKFIEKDIDYDGKLTILEVCNPLQASKIIAIDPRAVYMLPCKIIVRELNDSTSISMATPTSLIGIFENAKLVEIAQNIESIMIDAIEQV